MTTPVLVFDGDCGVCTKLAGVVRRRLRPDAVVVAWQQADLGTLALTPAQCDEALQWVAADGLVSSAQDAVARLLLASRLPFRPLGALLRVPGVNALAGVGYRLVAANRHRLPGGTPACVAPLSAPAGSPGAQPPRT